MSHEETIKQYQRMWNEQRLSSNEIAKLLGKTRNTVSGIISRAREAGWLFDKRSNRSPSPTPAPVPQPKQNAKPSSAIFNAKLSSAIFTEVPGEITILELASHHCRSVEGRSHKRGLPTYCGKPRIENMPYCEKHLKIYGVKPR